MSTAPGTVQPTGGKLKTLPRHSTAQHSNMLVILNGASSSGKSTIAKALLQIAPPPAIHLGADLLRQLVPSNHLPYVPLSDFGKGRHLALAQAVHGSAKSFYIAGFSVVLDHALYPANWLMSCALTLAEASPLLVGIECSEEQLCERERIRGDRPIGLAITVSRHVHKHGNYDLVVDTTNEAPATIAQRILDAYQSSERAALSRILTQQSWRLVSE